MKERLFVVDCTLREGDQTPGVAMRPDAKLRIAHLLDRAGVSLADAGMPEIGSEERAFLRDASRGCSSMVVGGSVRCLPRSVELALGCELRAVFVICPISRRHLEGRIGASLDRLLGDLERCAELVSGAGASLEVVAEDATRADPDQLRALASAAADLGAARVYLADTVGCRTPGQIATLVTDLSEVVTVPLGIHCHDDFGLGTANTLAAIEAGVRWPTATVNGIGERAGNASLEAVVCAAERLLEIDSGVDPTLLPELSRVVASASGMPVAWQAPIVGRNAFRHESGIHVDGVLKDPTSYEAYPPEWVGRGRSLVLGRHSGRAHLRALLAEMGYEPDAVHVEAVLSALRTEALERAARAPGEGVSLDRLREIVRACGEECA